LLLEKCLKRLGKVASRQIRRVSPKTPGAGAAGGLGFGLMVFAGATLRPGFELVAEMIGLESRIQKADVIVTGEGRLDEQTADGKAPAGVLHLARRHHKRVFAIVGESEPGVDKLFDGIWTLSSKVPDRERSIAMARELLRTTAGDMARHWQSASG
jgi:glycerate 2-kinase